jgi:Mg2+/Co2+ transporter CorB
MNDFLHLNIASPSTGTLLVLLVFMFFLSAFFSAAETAMMSINRYRLRHLAPRSKTAKKILLLLERPDRLLGAVLIGNTVANSISVSLGTLIAIRLFNDTGIILATAALTLCLLVFVEVAPKTLAALYPERIAYPSVHLLRFILSIMHPAIVFINGLSNLFLRLLGVKVTEQTAEQISGEELRSIVSDSGRLPHKHRSMLLGILDLEHVVIEDIMIPRNEIIGIDLSNSWGSILGQIAHSQHTFLPVYREDVDNVIGILHLKNAIHYIIKEKLSEETLLECISEPYFVPMATTLTTQLINFQKQLLRVALVVNEYGDIQGLVTLEDILEEIVGEFTTDFSNMNKQIYAQEDDSYLIDGGMSVRELNRTLGWRLPVKGAKTLSGLIVEYLENIPEIGTCLLIAQYPIEVISTKDNMVRTAKISPRIKKRVKKDPDTQEKEI